MAATQWQGAGLSLAALPSFGPNTRQSAPLAAPPIPDQRPASLEDMRELIHGLQDGISQQLERRLDLTESRLVERLGAVTGDALPLGTPTLQRILSRHAFASNESVGGNEVGCAPSLTSAGSKVKFSEKHHASTISESKILQEVEDGGTDRPSAEFVTAVDMDEEDATRRSSAGQVDEVGSDLADEKEHTTWTGPQCVQRLVQSPRFEPFFGVCILLNGIYIGVQTDWAAGHLNEEPLEIFFFSELIFTFLFTVELVLRVMYMGPCLFLVRSKERHWSWLDTVIVATSLVEALTEIIIRLGGSSNTSQSQSTAQFRIIRIIRVTRLVRIIRITRVIRFVRALRTMVHQLLSALKSLFWAILLLILIIYLFAIFFTQAVTGHLAAADGSGSTESIRIMLESWSTIPRAMLTLYMSITSGISWGVVIRPLADIGSVYMFVFVGYIVMAQLAVLNVLTGVFCQNAIDSAAHDADLVTHSMLQKREMYANRLRRIFEEIDHDHSGSITLKEFQAHLAHPRVQAYFDSLELDTTDVWTLFKLIDSDASKLIDVDEFVCGAMRLRGPAKGLDLLKLTYEHKWVSKNMLAFMKKTEEHLRNIHRNHSPAALVMALTGERPRKLASSFESASSNGFGANRGSSPT